MRIPAFAFVLLLSASSAACAGSFGAGIRVQEEIAAEETGLATYPGSTPAQKRHGDDDSAKIQIGFGPYGLKVVVAKLRSTDPIEKVAAYYRNELAQYGEVLDCSQPSAEERRPKSRKLSCEDDRPHKRGMLFKAGRKSDQHLVEISPRGEGSEFSLVHLKVNGLDWD